LKIDKLKVRDLYIKGYKYEEITKMLRYDNKESVRKCIQRNCSDLKDIHDENNRKLKFEKKEINKVLNYESNRYMSDRAIVFANPSAYKNNSRGDLVLINTNCAFPIDMPKVLRNEALREYEKTFLSSGGRK